MEIRGRGEDLYGNITIIRYYGSSLVLKRIARMRHASLSIHYASSFLAAPNEGGMKENNEQSMLSFRDPISSSFIVLEKLCTSRAFYICMLLLVQKMTSEEEKLITSILESIKRNDGRIEALSFLNIKVG